MYILKACTSRVHCLGMAFMAPKRSFKEHVAAQKTGTKMKPQNPRNPSGFILQKSTRRARSDLDARACAHAYRAHAERLPGGQALGQDGGEGHEARGGRHLRARYELSEVSQKSSLGMETSKAGQIQVPKMEKHSIALKSVVPWLTLTHTRDDGKLDGSSSDVSRPWNRGVGLAGPPRSALAPWPRETCGSRMPR